jgi:hypothetical protein
VLEFRSTAAIGPRILPFNIVQIEFLSREGLAAVFPGVVQVAIVSMSSRCTAPPFAQCVQRLENSHADFRAMHMHCFVPRAGQLQPQPPMPQQGPAAMPSALEAESAEPFFAGRLKTES